MSSIQLIVDGQKVYDNTATTPTPPADPPPVTQPPPVVDGSTSLALPTTQDGLVSYVQSCLDASKSAILSPEVNVKLQNPVVWTVRNSGLFGVIGNSAKLEWDGGLSDKDAVTFVSATNSEGFFVDRLSLYGGGYEGRQCNRGFVFNAPRGKPFYRAVLRDLYSSYCNAACISLIGDFFESAIFNPNVNACYGDGMTIENGQDGGIISNVMMFGVNLSRNLGYGLHLMNGASSVDVSLGSFIGNSKGGILAENGIRSVSFINGENTGQILIDVPFSAYPTKLVKCNLSSNGVTAGKGGVPSQYLYRYRGSDPSLCVADDCYVTPYAPSGGSAPTNMAVRAP